MASVSNAEALLSLRDSGLKSGATAAANPLLDDFDAVMVEHQRRIFRVLLAITHDDDAAQTLTQECFLKAWRARTSFRGESPVGAWLLRIAVNLARDHMRSKRTGFWRRLFAADAEPQQVEAAMADGRPSAERDLLAREKLRAVWTAAEQLSPQQRTVFALRFAEEMSLEEIAAATGLRTGTVKAHLFRAMAAVRGRVK